MNYGAAEKEIVDRLNQQIALNNASNLYEAALMPETNAEQISFYKNFTKARVAVEFIDSTPQQTNSINVVSQEETVRFRLTFEARKLRGPGNLYALLELVKLVLIGYQLTNAISRLTYVKYGLLDFEQGAWQPYFEFECKFVNVQVIDESDEIIGGNIQKITFPPDLIMGEFSKDFTNEFLIDESLIGTGSFGY